MNLRSAISGRALIDSSATVRATRRLIHGSLICRAIGHVAPRLGGRRSRFPNVEKSSGTPVQDEVYSDDLEPLFANSHVVTMVSMLVLGPFVAWPDTRVRQLIEPILRFDMPARVTIICCSVIAATVTHALLTAVLAHPTGPLGWSIRAGVVAACTLAMRRPQAVAAACIEWKARTSGAGGPHAG